MNECRAPLTIGSIVWGVRDVPRAIEFWCAALGYVTLREPDPDPDWAILVPRAAASLPSGESVQLAIMQVAAPAESRRRHHLDLYALDQAAEVERLLALGATRPAREYPENADYVTLADPDGNWFDVVQY